MLLSWEWTVISRTWVYSEPWDRRTIGHLVLLDDDEIKRAKEALRDCRKKIILPEMGEGRLAVSLRAWKLNQNRGFSANIRGKSQEKLQRIIDSISDCFSLAGLMPRRNDHMLLKVALANPFLTRRNQKWRVNGAAVSVPIRPMACGKLKPSRLWHAHHFRYLPLS